MEIVGVTEELLNQCLLKIEGESEEIISFIKEVFWKLWIKHLVQLRVPTNSVIDNYKQYIRASHKANTSLQQLINPNAMARCRLEDLEATIIVKQILSDIISTVTSIEKTTKITIVRGKPIPYKRRITVQKSSTKKVIESQPLKYIQMNSGRKNEVSFVSV